MSRILVGGDIAHGLDPADSILQREGWELVHAPTPESVLAEIRERPPDLVLLDGHGASFDAAACCRSIRNERSAAAIPVVFVTTPPDQLRFADAGGDGFISRPITLPRLLETMRRFVGLAERAGERLSLGLKAHYRGSDSEGIGIIRDIGPEGLFLQTRDAFRVGDEIELTFALPAPESRPLKVVAEVVRLGIPDPHHRHLAGIGVRFRALAGSDRLKITQFLRARLGEEA